KAVPFGDDDAFPLPERHGLYLDLLRESGAVYEEWNEALVAPTAAHRLFGQPDARQAHTWARGWLKARHWADGLGMPEPRELDEEPHAPTGRQVLAWALGCLARSGDHWYELNTFLVTLASLQGDSSFSLPVAGLAWEPKLVDQDEGKPSIPNRIRRGRVS